jgi:hypothetical protein
MDELVRRLAEDLLGDLPAARSFPGSEDERSAISWALLLVVRTKTLVEAQAVVEGP